jgi:hypothetical protein
MRDRYLSAIFKYFTHMIISSPTSGNTWWELSKTYQNSYLKFGNTRRVSGFNFILARKIFKHSFTISKTALIEHFLRVGQFVQSHWNKFLINLKVTKPNNILNKKK